MAKNSLKLYLKYQFSQELNDQLTGSQDVRK